MVLARPDTWAAVCTWVDLPVQTYRHDRRQPSANGVNGWDIRKERTRGSSVGSLGSSGLGGLPAAAQARRRSPCGVSEADRIRQRVAQIIHMCTWQLVHALVIPTPTLA